MILALTILLVLFAVHLLPAQSRSGFDGVWTGGWESGKIKLTISRDSDGKAVAKLWVAPENGEEYTTGFSEFVLEGNTMRARYNSPDSDPGEVVLEANLEGDTLRGTWQFRQKAKDETHSGTWKATRL
jgi:hypothetical protein